MAEQRRLYRADVAELAGISVRSLGRANLPQPDGHEMDAGHARPWWYESRVQTWYATRPGKGWRSGRTGQHGASR